MTTENKYNELQRWAELKMESFEHLQNTAIVLGTSIFAGSFFAIKLGYTVGYLKDKCPEKLQHAINEATIIAAGKYSKLNYKILNTNLK